jgi:predicted transcriptional regulator
MQTLADHAIRTSLRQVFMENPEAKSVFDTPLDSAEEARLDAIADAEIDAGKGVPHEKLREWLEKLATGEKVPPPTA